MVGILQWAKALADAPRLRRPQGMGDTYRIERDVYRRERDVYRRERDVALHERNEILRQRDVQIGQVNFLTGRLARCQHRADLSAPAAATRDRLLLFLHVGKTGGMTLAYIFARNFGLDEFLQVDVAETDISTLGVWSDVAIRRALSRLQTHEIDKLRAIWGHYFQGVQVCLPKACSVVTLLRDPVDRIISGAFYSNHYDHQNIAELEGEFGEHCNVGNDNAMCRVLSGNPALNPRGEPSETTTEFFARVTTVDFNAAASNLDGYLVAGTTDRFDETLLVLGRDPRWSLSDLVYTPINVTASRPTQTDISDALRNKILRWNRYDAMLVDQARAHLARRIASYPGDFNRDLSLFRELKTEFQRGVSDEELRRIERRTRSALRP
jgi:hypothetical protein